MCRFGLADAAQGRWWKAASRADRAKSGDCGGLMGTLPGRRFALGPRNCQRAWDGHGTLSWFELFVADSAASGCRTGASPGRSMLSVARLFSRHMPIRHPAELFAFAGFEDDEEGIERNFFLLLSEPGFQFVGQECRDNFVISVPGAELKVESDVQVAGSTAARASLGSRFWRSCRARQTAYGESDTSYDIECSKRIAQPRPSLLILEPRSSAGNCNRHRLRLDRSLIDQHDGDIVLYRVDPVALLTLKAFRVWRY